MKSFLLITGLLLLIAVEILRVYFIMPFPGSQHKDTIDLAYWIDRNIIWLRIVLLLLIAYPAIYILRHSKIWRKVLLCLGLVFYAVVFYFFNFRFLAEKMFLQPHTQTFALAADNKIKGETLVLGVEINGESKAYPIQIIGYHHQVRDVVGNTPVMITYCTVCRTGRAFSPVVNGKVETFRLVGMDHFNAMFEDATTKSWWRQATGVAITGPLKGTALKELPSHQTTLSVWLREHPSSAIMQPDTLFTRQYADLALYDNGTIKGGLERRDSLSWKPKSWVIGIDQNNAAKAYDWNQLVREKWIQDSLPGLPLLISLEKDKVNFHVWDRTVNGKVLQFDQAPSADELTDRDTHSTWNSDGLCVDGALKGNKLQPVQAYQEFWHSWQTFHPRTTKYK